MILDFTKLFPSSCEKLKITSWAVNIADIVVLKQVYSSGIGYNSQPESTIHIQIGRETHKLLNIDDGIVKLHSILACYSLLMEYERSKDFITESDKAKSEKQIEISKAFLAQSYAEYSLTIPD